jgi:hypothetical protein
MEEGSRAVDGGRRRKGIRAFLMEDAMGPGVARAMDLSKRGFRTEILFTSNGSLASCQRYRYIIHQPSVMIYGI